MNRESYGMSPPELLIFVAAASLALCATAVRLLPLSGASTDLPAVDSVHVLLQLARVEAASRDVPCRFVFEPGSQMLRVFDTLGTDQRQDDRLLYKTRLAGHVALSRMERWHPLPSEFAQHPFEVIFQPSGRVSSGAGKILIASELGDETLSIYETGELAVVTASGS